MPRGIGDWAMRRDMAEAPRATVGLGRNRHSYGARILQLQPLHLRGSHAADLGEVFEVDREPSLTLWFSLSCDPSMATEEFDDGGPVALGLRRFHAVKIHSPVTKRRTKE